MSCKSAFNNLYVKLIPLFNCKAFNVSYFPEIIIGADHAGFELKEIFIDVMRRQDIPVQDIGCFSKESVDYPDIAAKVAQQVIETHGAGGVLICGSGIGVSMAANRFNGIRAVLANDFHAAKWSRLHNNANVFCIGARVAAPEMATQLLDLWLNTKYEGERHEHRVHLMDKLVTSADNKELPSTETRPASCNS